MKLTCRRSAHANKFLRMFSARKVRQRRLFQYCSFLGKDNVARASVRTTFNDDPELFKNVMTGDESWVYGYGIQTKAQPFQWKRPEEPRSKKSRHIRLNLKVYCLVYHEFFPQGTLNQSRSWSDIKRKCEKICF